MQNEVTKRCTVCNEYKNIDTDFYTQIQKSETHPNIGWRYYDSMCKECRGTYGSERRRRIKAQAVLYLGGECKDCHLKDSIEVYDFHHRAPNQKDFSISAFGSRSFKSIQPELDKCDLLCANCHRKRHYSGI